MLKVSEITANVVRAYARIDENSDEDSLIDAMISAATTFATSYTGLTATQLDDYPDITLAVLTIIADMYDVRAFTMNGIQINPTAARILGSHCQNFI